MAGNPGVDFMRRINGIASRPTGPAQTVADLALDSADPRYRTRFPEPEPDDEVIEIGPGGERWTQPAAPRPVTTAPVAGGTRAMIAYGPFAGEFLVSIVPADLSETLASGVFDRKSLREMLPILRALTTILDLTGGAAHAAVRESEVDPAAGSRGRAASEVPDDSDRSGERADRGGAPPRGSARRGSRSREDSARRDVGTDRSAGDDASAAAVEE